MQTNLWLAKNSLILFVLVTCNQAIYDQLYAQVVRMNFEISLKQLNEVNEYVHYENEYTKEQKADFEILRKLCNGQLSTYERNP
jgi:hypothetical protein